MQHIHAIIERCAAAGAGEVGADVRVDDVRMYLHRIRPRERRGHRVDIVQRAEDRGR